MLQIINRQNNIKLHTYDENWGNRYKDLAQGFSRNSSSFPSLWFCWMPQLTPGLRPVPCLRVGLSVHFPLYPAALLSWPTRTRKDLLQSPDDPQDGVWDANSRGAPWPLWIPRTTTFPNFNQIQTRKRQEKSRLGPKKLSSLSTPGSKDNRVQTYQIPVSDDCMCPPRWVSPDSLSTLPPDTALPHPHFSGHQASHQWRKMSALEISSLPRACRIHLCRSQRAARHRACASVVQQWPPAAGVPLERTKCLHSVLSQGNLIPARWPTWEDRTAFQKTYARHL